MVARRRGRRGRRTRAGGPRRAEGSLRRWPEPTELRLRPRRRDRRPDRRPRGAPRLARSADAPPLPRRSSSTRTTTTASPTCSPRHPALEVAAPALGARALARAERRARRSSTADARRVPGRRLPLPARPPRARRARGSPTTRRSAGSAAGRSRPDGAADRPLAERTPRRVEPDDRLARANSHTIFLRRDVVERVGAFDEALGLGSGTPWSSGEEIDYLVRALRSGARIEYDPALVVTHPVKPVTPAELVALGRRDGASVGYILAPARLPGARRSRGCSSAPASAALALARAARRDPRAVPRRDASRAAAGLRAAARAAERASSAKIAAWRSSQSASAKRSTARARAAAPRSARGRRGRPTTAAASASGAGGSSRSKPSRMRDADAGLVADELDRAAARRRRRRARRRPSPRSRPSGTGR